MLAGELQAYNKRVAAGEVSPVPQPQPPAPPSLAGLHIGSGAPISQSLPSGGHLALVGGRGPEMFVLYALSRGVFAAGGLFPVEKRAGEGRK